MQIYSKIRENWEKESGPYGHQYGNIVYLETGTGKTYIAIMLLRALFYSDIEKQGLSDAQMCEEALKTQTEALSPLSDDQVDKMYIDRQNLLDQSYKSHEKKVLFNKQNKKAIFIIPTQNLVEQQANSIDRYTNLTVGRYHGGTKQRRFYIDFHAW